MEHATTELGVKGRYEPLVEEVHSFSPQPATDSFPRLGDSRKARAPQIFASSVEPVGKFWLGKLTKHVIQGEFGDSEGPKAVGLSHGHFHLVV